MDHAEMIQQVEAKMEWMVPTLVRLDVSETYLNASGASDGPGQVS